MADQFLIRLQGVGKTLEGQHWEFHGETVIGRATIADLQLDHPSISRKHASLAPTRQGWVVRDLGSSNGTFVSGVRVATAARRLQPGDLLQCGQLMFRVTDAVLATPGHHRANDASSVEMSGVVMTIQSVAKRSWEQGLESLGDHEERRRQGKHFLTLLRAGYHVSRLTSLDEMLQSVLEDTAAVLDAQRGAFILLEGPTGQITPRAVWPRPAGAAGAKVFSRTLVQRCLEKGESTHCMRADVNDLLKNSDSSATRTMASVICALLRSPRQRVGVLHLERGLLQEPFTEEDFQLADAIAATISVSVETGLTIEKQRGSFLQDIASLGRRAVEMHDRSAASHNERVTAYALCIAEELGLSPEECRLLRLGAPLHDIGKLAVPDRVLAKPGELTEADVERIRAHTTHGAAMVESVADLAMIAPIVRSHHERWDGQGYPDGLVGEAIPLLARIVSVAEAFDTMTSEQPYRQRLTVRQAFDEIAGGSAKQFDPRCVDAFLHAGPAVERLLANFETQRTNSPSATERWHSPVAGSAGADAPARER